MNLVIAQTEVSHHVLVSGEESPFRRPSAMALGVSGLLYVADTGNNRLVAVDSLGHIVLESSKGGSSGELRWPVDVTVGAGGKVYVCDSGNRRIVEFSRLLEWKGELEVLNAAKNTLEPRLLAANPVGDLFVYESDDSQLIRYDSFFNVIARLGGQSGRSIVAPHSMTYSAPLGLLWISRQGDHIYRSDEFLGDPRSYRAIQTKQTFWDIAAIDSVFYAIGDSDVFRYSGTALDSLPLHDILTEESRPIDLRIAAGAFDKLYILDTKRGSIQSLYWP